MTCLHAGWPRARGGGNGQELKVNTSGTKNKRAILDVIIEDIVRSSSPAFRIVVSVNKSVPEVPAWKTRGLIPGRRKEV